MCLRIDFRFSVRLDESGMVSSPRRCRPWKPIDRIVRNSLSSNEFPEPEATISMSSSEIGSLRETGLERVFMAPRRVFLTMGWSVTDLTKGHWGSREDAMPER